MAAIDDKIKAIMDEAKRKAEQLRKREEEIHARKLEAVVKKDRATDTRRKILLGALIEVMMEEDEKTKTIILKRLEVFLTKAADRDLFDLPTKQKTVTSGDDHDAATA